MTGNLMPHLLLLLVFLLALPAGAQDVSPVVNQLDSERPLLDLPRGDIIPDTTEPWRYFPLQVGNTWEYYQWHDGRRHRDVVTHVNTINDIDYYSYERFSRDAQGNPVPGFRVNLRYDSTSARIWEYRDGEEVPTWFIMEALTEFPCALDLPFGSICELAGLSYLEVSGGYGLPVVFGGPMPYEDPDTLYTSIKQYFMPAGGSQETAIFAADVGFIFWHFDEFGWSYSLYYAKVDGKEYGQSYFPIGNENNGPIRGPADAHLQVWPNPTYDRITVSVRLARATHIGWIVYDLLGREIMRHEGLPHESQDHVITLDVSHLVSGTYVIKTMGDYNITSRFTIIN